MRGAPAAGVLFLFVLGCLGAPPDAGDAPASSRSYQGHETERDGDRLVEVYPALVGTRLDDCQTCHSGRIEEGRLVASSCDFCHDLLLFEEGHLAQETLNGFGRDYLAAGRSVEALERIKEEDSDADGFSNDQEILAGRYPGSNRSLPGQATAALLTLGRNEIQALPRHRQFLLANNTQQQFDDYVTYGGTRLGALLEAAGVDLTGATGITVIAPDGYMKSLPIEYVNTVFPRPLYYGGLGEESLGAGCGVVKYPEAIPEGVSDGAPLPDEIHLLLAYERDGLALEPTALDVTDGKITGEGPYRVVVPQANPGRPDRGTRFSPSACGDGLDFRPDADHNAGSMVRGVIAIRIDPMPPGVEEFDYMNGGWAYVDSGELIIYGYGVR
jgi:hypothetical protein